MRFIIKKIFDLKKPILIAAILLILQATLASGKNLPFAPGEKLTFRIKWCFIPAGEAVLQILPLEELEGIKAYHFVMTAKTYPLVDVFYKVRDRIDAFTDTGMNHSISYKKSKRGKHKKEVAVSFDWEKLLAQYNNFKKKKDPVSILPGSFDPLTVFYAFRVHQLKQGKILEKPVTDGKKCVLAKAKVVKRENIKVLGKTYDTYLVEPELKHIGDAFKKSKDAKLQIWVTADERRIPVRLKSRVKVGNFVGELVSMEPGDSNKADIY